MLSTKIGCGGRYESTIKAQSRRQVYDPTTWHTGDDRRGDFVVGDGSRNIRIVKNPNALVVLKTFKSRGYLAIDAMDTPTERPFSVKSRGNSLVRRNMLKFRRSAAVPKAGVLCFGILTRHYGHKVRKPNPDVSVLPVFHRERGLRRLDSNGGRVSYRADIWFCQCRYVV